MTGSHPIDEEDLRILLANKERERDLLMEAIKGTLGGKLRNIDMKKIMTNEG